MKPMAKVLALCHQVTVIIIISTIIIKTLPPNPLRTAFNKKLPDFSVAGIFDPFL